MLHWMLLWVLIVCCCSMVGLFLTCWGVYLYLCVPFWVVFLIFLISCTGVLLIVLCWLYCYSDKTNIFSKKKNEVFVLFPLTITNTITPRTESVIPQCTTPFTEHQCVMKRQTQIFPIWIFELNSVDRKVLWNYFQCRYNKKTTVL